MKEWHSEQHAIFFPFSLCLMESELESDPVFFLLADGDVAVFSTGFRIRVKSYGFRKLMTIIIDHNKQRCHGDGAVYFMHSMTPCTLWSIILTVTGSSC